MTESQILIVKKTWNMFRHIDPIIVGDVFYSRLFFKEPALSKLFKHSMKEQYKKLTDMLSTIIARLERLDEVNEDLVQLANRHVQYGVKPEHYKMVGDALLWTLEQGLGNDWNPEVQEAWTNCYQVLSTTMIGTRIRRE